MSASGAPTVVSTFERTLERAWALHTDSPRAACAKVESAIDAINDSHEIGAAARFLFHVYGVHFGEWAAGTKALRALRMSAAWQKNSEAERVIRRSLRALELAWADDDGEVDLDKLNASEQVQAYALAAQCLMERGDDVRAMEYLQTAAARAEALDTPQDPSFRDMAVAGNNIATAYAEFPLLDASQRDQMIVAAHIGRMFWARIGTWLELERAEYRLAKCTLIAGYPALAVTHAQSCLRICDNHKAPALEFFFGVEALTAALAAQGEFSQVARLKEKAASLFVALDEADQRWCRPTLEGIAALRVDVAPV